MSMPDACLKAGNKCENKPDCSVDVVEAITMLGACAWATLLPNVKATASKLANENKSKLQFERRVIPTLLLKTNVPRGDCHPKVD